MNGIKRRDSTDVREETSQEISYADGALELEAPEDGATIENPPNGGIRAWLIVLSCAGINCLQSSMILLIRLSLITEDESSVMSSDTGIDSGTLVEVSDNFLNISDVYAPFAAFVMIFLGYQATVCIGAGVVMATLFFLSYLGDDDTEHFIKFLIYGPIAVGISFIRLGALIPVMEYFTTKRLKALFLSRLGLYIGPAILIGLLLIIIQNFSFQWRISLRAASALCIGIGLTGLTLKDLKLRMKDDESATFVQRTLGLGKKDILRNILLWLTCVVYFFYQWGIEPVQAMFINLDMARRLNFGDNLAIGQLNGMIIGSFLAWILKKVALEENNRWYSIKLKNGLLNVLFGTLIFNAFTMGVGCFIAPHAVKFGYFFTFSLVYGAFFAFCEGMRDDAIPKQFGRENIRIVASFIMMSSGLGSVITHEISDELDNDEDDGWKNTFRYGGGMLMFSAIFTALVLYLKGSKILDQITSKLNGNTASPLQTASEDQTVTKGTRRPKERTNAQIQRTPTPGKDDITDSNVQQVNGVYQSDEQRQTHSRNQTRQAAEPISMHDLGRKHRKKIKHYRDGSDFYMEEVSSQPYSNMSRKKPEDMRVYNTNVSQMPTSYSQEHLAHHRQLQQREVGKVHHTAYDGNHDRHRHHSPDGRHFRCKCPYCVQRYDAMRHAHSANHVLDEIQREYRTEEEDGDKPIRDRRGDAYLWRSRSSFSDLNIPRPYYEMSGLPHYFAYYGPSIAADI